MSWPSAPASFLHWLDLQKKADPSAVIGLTATPFRGFNKDETKRLVNRFDGRLLPSEHADLYEELRAQTVLARVTHELLETQHSVALSGAGLKYFQDHHKLSPSTLRELSNDDRRNDRIVERILDLPEDKQILLFACSKDHAKHLAARLHLAGRKAACIVGETRGGVRQHFIRAFLGGEIQVLTNFGVLTTGFDAPKVDVIVIARPTFSPGLYQQMIGRGLRGPLNGGKPVCHLITVLDTFVRFGEALAFHHFGHLWS